MATEASAARQLKMHLNIDMNTLAPSALKLVDTSTIATIQEFQGVGQYHGEDFGGKWIGGRLMNDAATQEYVGMLWLRSLPGQAPRDRRSDDQVFVLRRVLAEDMVEHT